MIRASVKPEIWKWAIDRVGDRAEHLRAQFPNLDQWQRGEALPTIKQLEAFASAAYVPLGYLFLTEPPNEQLPVNDFRTMQGRAVLRPSPNLLDTIYLCQMRQAWYRDHAEANGEEAIGFVGSATTSSAPEHVAADMRKQLAFDVAERWQFDNWETAFRRFIEQAEDAGILVMVSGVVGSNNYRSLNPDEFRGFALADSLSPLIFVNGADVKSAQMFTLAHELAHIWLGQSALGDSTPSASNAIEQWCNAVAAEFLVPLVKLLELLKYEGDPLDSLSKLARAFKVSSLVILRRLLDAKKISRPQFDSIYALEVSRFTKARQGGGNFYATQVVRLSKRFARAIITSAFEGQTPFRDAFQMLGISSDSTFRQLGRELGVAFK